MRQTRRCWRGGMARTNVAGEEELAEMVRRIGVQAGHAQARRHGIIGNARNADNEQACVYVKVQSRAVSTYRSLKLFELRKQ